MNSPVPFVQTLNSPVPNKADGSDGMLLQFVVDVHPHNIRKTNERPVYHAACKDEYRILNLSNSQLTCLEELRNKTDWVCIFRFEKIVVCDHGGRLRL